MSLKFPSWKNWLFEVVLWGGAAISIVTLLPSVTQGCNTIISPLGFVVGFAILFVFHRIVHLFESATQKKIIEEI